MKEREAGVPTTKMSRSRGVRWDGGAGGLAVAVEEVGGGGGVERWPGSGGAGGEVSAGLEEPGGEAGAMRGLAEGQRGAGLEEPGGEARATRGLAEGQRGALAWRSPADGHWPGGAQRRGLEERCLADGGGRRSVFKLGVFLYFCTFSPGRRTPSEAPTSQRQLFWNGGSISTDRNFWNMFHAHPLVQ